MAQSAPLFSSAQMGVIDDSAKQKYLEEEKERLRLFEVCFLTSSSKSYFSHFFE